MMTALFGGDDEKDAQKTTEEEKGGPEAGEYVHPVPVPDGQDALDNSKQ